MEIAFLPAPDEGSLYQETVQRDLNAATSQLTGPGISHRRFTQDSIDVVTINLGEVIIKLGIGVITGVASVAAAWLHARAGRKLRIKIGDIEVEAGTPKELKGLLETVQKVEREAAERSTSGNRWTL
jgi:hypothetical protein